MAYTLIETITVDSGGASSIEFDSIEAVDGADLKVLISARSNASGVATEYRFQFNGDTSSVYYTTGVAGDGSTINNRSAGPTSFLENLSLQKNGATANTFGNGELYISNFSSAQDTVASFTAVSENNASEAYQGMAAFLRDVAEAITSIKIYATVGDFMEHTTASLYLVTTADASGATGGAAFPKATGGTISLSGGYWYHTFTSSSTFTPTEALTCDYLVVAGGAGGGNARYSTGGGGGAGGYIAVASSAFTATGYSAVVGSGGAGGNDSTGHGGQGSNSSFKGTSTSGGGSGGGRNSGNTMINAASGGSGGGGHQFNGSGASGTGGQGTSGGAGSDSDSTAGGGGGKSTAGADGAATAGNGGSGATWLDGNAYAGGGGGGAILSGDFPGQPGFGGGGRGGQRADVGDAGTANTGGGGGGGGGQSNFTAFNGGAGGSGVVIVRYAA